jgi:hypothetical protein
MYYPFSRHKDSVDDKEEVPVENRGKQISNQVIKFQDLVNADKITTISATITAKESYQSVKSGKL